MLPFGYVSLLSHVAIMNLHSGRKKRKPKKLASGRRPADPWTTESASKRTQRPSASIFTVWWGSLPTATYGRGHGGRERERESLEFSEDADMNILCPIFQVRCKLRWSELPWSHLSLGGAAWPNQTTFGNLNDIVGALTAAFDQLEFVGSWF